MRCAPVPLARAPAASIAACAAIPRVVPSTRPCADHRPRLVLRWQGTPPVAHWVQIDAPDAASPVVGARRTAAPRSQRGSLRRSERRLRVRTACPVHRTGDLHPRAHARTAAIKE